MRIAPPGAGLLTAAWREGGREGAWPRRGRGGAAHALGGAAARGACLGGVPRWRRPCWAPGVAVRRQRPGPEAAAAGGTKPPHRLPASAQPLKPQLAVASRGGRRCAAACPGACNRALRAQRWPPPLWRGLARRRRRWAPAPAAVTSPLSSPSCGPWWRIPTPTRSSAGAR